MIRIFVLTEASTVPCFHIWLMFMSVFCEGMAQLVNQCGSWLQESNVPPMRNRELGRHWPEALNGPAARDNLAEEDVRESKPWRLGS